MTSVNQVPDFKAKWAPHNNELKPLPFRSVMERVIYIVKEIIVYIPRAIASSITRRLIYPAASPSISNTTTQKIADEHFDTFWKTTQTRDSRENYNNAWFPCESEKLYAIRNTYTANEITLESPDNKTLHGHYIKHKDAGTPGAKVILAFGGNGLPYHFGFVTNWMQEMLCDHETPHSFLMINPRGVFKSTGKPTQNGLVLDADTLYQYAEHLLGYDKDNIILYGHSMGGAMAAHLKALHTDSNAPLILSRTFSSLSKQSEDISSKLPFQPTRLVKWIIRNLGWRFDNVKQLGKIKSPVHIFNHKYDYAIPEFVGLHTAMNMSENKKDHIHTHKVVGGLDSHMSKLSELRTTPQHLNVAEYLKKHVFTVETAVSASA
ncbi:hypothetical protein COB11_05725 [Candidatus Aerophobetes bacterium]|uniref:AB hydrolase-1 domain-containing protein n=1 Tax=Aerophobetes bacterium TaxID=2030807 RepID=A0A2A4YER5_UNCAE|nr:MAG: hypothetical protein COB11_05725 [Candidatus Aerophobetes bacterium]